MKSTQWLETFRLVERIQVCHTNSTPLKLVKCTIVQGKSSNLTIGFLLEHAASIGRLYHYYHTDITTKVKYRRPDTFAASFSLSRTCTPHLSALKAIRGSISIHFHIFTILLLVTFNLQTGKQNLSRGHPLTPSIHNFLLDGVYAMYGILRVPIERGSIVQFHVPYTYLVLSITSCV